MKRSDGRANDELRPVMLERGTISQNDFDLVWLVRLGSTNIPEAGTYPIVTEDTVAEGEVFFARLTMRRPDGRESILSSQIGTLTIDAVESEEITGTLSFDATLLQATGDPFGQAVTVAGSFRASVLVSVGF